uniref:Uncharacterized protein n=1 Tax=Avena sativa TaxID=4498 RepID=A0ACD5X5E6_AVESA
MAAPVLLLGLLLIASAATAHDELPHLELPATLDSGPAHGSDAPQGLMDIMSVSGCGRFAALVAATPNASDIFEQRVVAGGGGLTVFCPDDKAVAGFAPTFLALADTDRLNVLLHHGAAGRYVRAQLAGFRWVAVPTLAVADAATGEAQTVLVREHNGTMRLWPTWPAESVARVRKTVDSSSEEAPLLVLHVIDAVLLRKKLDGAGGDGAAAAGACSGRLGWLHMCIPVWVVLLWVFVVIVSFFAGMLMQSWWGSMKDE